MDISLLNRKSKQLLLILTFGILSGCIYFHILWKLQDSLFRNEWGMLADRMLENSIKELFGLALGPWMVILAGHILLSILGFTKFGKILIQGLVFCMGVIYGALETLLFLNFHIKTCAIFLLKCAIVLVPYVLLIGITMTLSCSMSFLNWTALEKTKKWKAIQLKKYILAVSMTLLLHVVYIILCSYVNFGKINLKFF